MSVRELECECGNRDSDEGGALPICSNDCGRHMTETDGYCHPARGVEDVVNHPKHYNDHPSGVECIVIAEWMNYCLGQVLKYIWRAGIKSSATHIQDLEKARWYLDREINRLKEVGK